jgi:hypothetical protein
LAQGARLAVPTAVLDRVLQGSLSVGIVELDDTSAAGPPPRASVTSSFGSVRSVTRDTRTATSSAVVAGQATVAELAIARRSSSSSLGADPHPCPVGSKPRIEPQGAHGCDVQTMVSVSSTRPSERIGRQEDSS